MKRNRLFPVILLSILLVVSLVLYLKKGGTGAAGMVNHSVRISEVMTSNKGAVPDENGDFPDWVEIENTSSSAVDISGYGLSDDLISIKWTFPSGTIVEPGGFLVVYCSGDVTKGSLHTPFKLSSDDVLILSTEAGATVDSIQLKSITSGCTLARDVSGNFSEQKPSPGYPNTEAGIAAFLKDMEAPATEDVGVYLNEFMASNKSTLLGPDGSYCDWIELYNTTGGTVDLSGYGISDDPSNPLKYTLPAGTVIEPYGTLLMYCTGLKGTSPTVIELPFGLASYQESVVLSTPKGRILDSIDYSRQETDVSMARVPDGTGEWRTTSQPSPGYLNNSAGVSAFQTSQGYGTGDLIISEVLNANKTYLKQEDGNYYDWIELSNRSSQSISLAGYALSDNAKNPAKWVFPDVSIGPGEYLVVLASGKNNRNPGSLLETNFGISSRGETVLLFSPEGKILDKLEPGPAHVNVSYGRNTSGVAMYYTAPTPGAANGSGCTAYAGTPSFGVNGGVYREAQAVSIEIPEGTTVTYTTDGSIPTQASSPYQGPVSLGSGVTVLRARAFGAGLMDSDVATATYYVLDSGNSMAAHDFTIPVISLTADPDALFGEVNGIYVAGKEYYEKSGGRDSATSFTILYDSKSDYWKQANFNAQHITHPDPLGRNWERDCHIEYFDAAGIKQYDADLVCRIFGAFSRYKSQKGIALVARTGYGDSAIEYPFFENRSYSSFQALSLRCSAMDVGFTRIRDILIQGLLEDGGSILPTQSYVQVALYVNGSYWGVYNLREKVNKHFIASRYGLADPDKIDILVGNGNNKQCVVSGEEKCWKDYQALVEYADTHDLRDSSNYAYVCSQMDVDNFAEYCAMEIYVGNTDSGNIKYWRSAETDNKWRWIPYDFDWALNYDDDNGESTTTGWRRDFFSKYFNPSGHGASAGFSTKLSRALLKNSSFRALFLQKCALMMRIFDTDVMKARIDELSNNISQEMQYDTERWPTLRYKTWNTRINRLKESAEKVPEYFLKHLQNYFSLSDKEMVTLFGRKSSLK